MTRVIWILILSLVAAPASADTIHVNWNGTGDYESIGEGVAAAGAGDTVLVATGTYMGANNRNISVNHAMTVMSEGGRRSVTINAEGAGRVFYLGADCVISGFTIQNGAEFHGGGLASDGASPTVIDCHITGCDATSGTTGGGGICFRYDGTPTLIDVDVTSCLANHRGGGMMFYGGTTPTLTRVRCAGNVSSSSGGGCYLGSTDGTATFTDCVFYANQVVPVSTGGGGLMVSTCSPVITGCTFARNKGSQGGCIRLSGGASPTIENSILCFSTAGPPIGRPTENEVPTTTRCIVYGNEWSDDLVGNFSDILYEDPRFCGMLSGDLTLCSNSAALPDNNPWTVLMGAHGEGCGDCETPVEDATWGRIKGLYR
jgi:hypothetical protein